MHHFMVAAIDAMLKHLTSDQDCVRPFTPLRDLPWPPTRITIFISALWLDLPLLKRFFSFSLFLLLDEPQPRKTNGEDHHYDQNGVL
jgi:hypothetical protein